MNFAFSEEQEELRRTVRQFLEAKSPETEVRRLMETTEGYDPAVWKQMGQELGLQGLAIPEEYGGQGFTFIELGIVLEEMGRVLLCAPYFSSVVLAANAILNAGTDDAEEGSCCPASRRGDTIAALAFTEPNGQVGRGRHHDGGDGVGGDGFTLVGREDVRDRRPHRRPRSSSSPARPARAATDGISFFTVDGDADGPHPHAAVDDGHDAQAGEARVRRRRGDAARQHRRRLGRVLARRSTRPRSRSSNEMMGGAQKVLEMSVEYAKVRVQFGRPIGSFQAIKHKCADMLLEVESGKSAAYYASWAAAEDNDELPVVAALVEGVLLRGVLPRRRREHPDPRRHRLHVGAPRAPVLQARPRAPRSTSATRRTTASCSRSASASDRHDHLNVH